MSLFIQSILSNYNILNYQNNFLLFHCSRHDVICSPFEGECVKINKDTCMIYNNDIKLYIYHLSNITEGHVKKNDVVGYPIVSYMNNNKIAYIGLKMYDNKNNMYDLLTYKETVTKPVIEVTEEVKKPTKRKSINKKKETKNRDKS